MCPGGDVPVTAPAMEDLIMRSSVRLVLLLLVSVLAATMAWSGGWVHLGKRTVDHRGDHDVISVKGAPGACRSIRLEVRNRPVDFFDLKVRFENGQVLDVKLAKRILAGGYTRVIDLPGGQRNIDKVEFNYRTAGPKRGKAVVHLWAR